MLVTCLDCNHQISSRAKSCPKCGAPISLPTDLSDTASQPAQQVSSTPSSPQSTEPFAINGFIQRAVVATVALVVFRLFLMEGFYTVLMNLVIAQEYSSIERLFVTYDMDEIVSDFTFGYAAPWVVFFLAGPAITVVTLGIIFALEYSG